jgi:FkbM family methyltransferase
MENEVVELGFGWAVPRCLTGFAFPLFLQNDPAFRKSPLSVFSPKLVCAFRLLISKSFVYPLGASGGRIVVDRNDKVARRLFYVGNFDSEVGTVLSTFLRPAMTFFDVGANVGFFSILASRLVGPKGHVFSFEPDSRNFDRLARNISVSRISNVVLNRMALMDKDGSIKLKVLAEDGWGMYSSVGEPLTGVKEPRGLSGETVTQHVKCSTMDSYVMENKIGEIDLVKIDVEGAELSVLRGGKKLLGRKRGPALVIEFNRITAGILGYDLFQLRQYVESLGYTLYRVTKEGRILTKLGDVLDISRYENLVALKGTHSLIGFPRD